MAHAYYCSEYNSTPFSSCCNVASQDWNGNTAKTCAKCGEEITYTQPTPGMIAARKRRAQGKCGLCGAPINKCCC